MIEQLASLLLPIDALLAHADFNPRNVPSPEIVTLFRSAWFLCILFGFTTTNNTEATAMDWLKPALARIAIKTPSMVVEESHDAVASDVEYNSVIRQDYANTVSSSHSASCASNLKYHIGDIKTPKCLSELYLIPGQRYTIFIIWPSHIHSHSP
jgi:phosphatidylinositol 4-kinase